MTLRLGLCLAEVGGILEVWNGWQCAGGPRAALHVRCAVGHRLCAASLETTMVLLYGLALAEGVATSEGIFGLAKYPLHLSTEAKLQLKERGGGLPNRAPHIRQLRCRDVPVLAAASEFHRQLEVEYLSRDVQDSEGDVGLQP